MRLELRHAQVVAAIARTGSISRAAVELSLPQPSLTTQLRRIERLVGGDLFVRTRRGVLPTPLGERVIPLLVELLRQSDEVMAQARHGVPDVVRFGVVDWTPSSLRLALDAALPQHDVETTTVSAAAVLPELERGSLSAAVVTLAGGLSALPTGLASSLVTRERVWLAVPTRPRGLRGSEPDGRTATGPWVGYAAEHPLAEADARAQRRFDVPARQVVHHVASQSEAVAWVTETGATAVVAPTGPLGDVTVLDPGLDLTCSHHLVHRVDTLSDESVQHLLGVLRLHFCDSARRVPGYWTWLLAHQADLPELADALGALTALVDDRPRTVDVTTGTGGAGVQDLRARSATRRPISSPTTSPASLLTE